MGQAFTSVPNDVQGLIYNPASLATLSSSQMSFQHLSYVEQITQESVAYGNAGREEALSWGGFIDYFRVGGIERTVYDSNVREGFSQTGNFSTYDMALGLSAAGRMYEGLSVGTTLKFLRESLADASANAAAVDAGVLYQGNDERTWNVGVSILNVGKATRFADANVPLPWTLRVGASAQPFAQWLISADYVKRQDLEGELDSGIEVAPIRPLSLRLGYRYALNKTDLGGLANFSAGVGLRFNKVSLDYAFVPLGDLGLTHRVSMNLRFAPRW